MIVTNRCMIDKHMEKVLKQNRTVLDEDCLRWTPLVHTNLALIDDTDKTVNGLDGLGRRNRPSLNEQDVDIVNDEMDAEVSVFVVLVVPYRKLNKSNMCSSHFS